MAYTLRYWSEWVDFKGNNHRLEIKKDGFAGAAEFVRLTDCKEEIPKYELFEDQCIYGGGLSFAVISPTRLLFLKELYTSNPFALHLTHSINAATNFIGWVDSEQYQDPFSQEMNYPISVVGNNGVKILERVKVPALTGVHTYFDLFFHLLNPAQLAFSRLNIAVSTTKAGQQGFPAGETLFHSIYHLADNFVDESGSVCTCKEALSILLLSFCAKMWIYQGQVYIIDVQTLASATVTYRSYNFATKAFVSDIIINHHVTLDELIEREENLEYKNGLNEVVVQVSGYGFSNPKTWDIKEENFTNYSRTDTRYKDSGDPAIPDYQYEEKIYLGCNGFVVDDTWAGKIEFVHMDAFEYNEGDSEEDYIRIRGGGACRPPLLINTMTSIFHLDTGLFVFPYDSVVIDFDVTVEYLPQYRTKKKINQITYGSSNQYTINPNYFVCFYAIRVGDMMYDPIGRMWVPFTAIHLIPWLHRLVYNTSAEYNIVNEATTIDVNTWYSSSSLSTGFRYRNDVPTEEPFSWTMGFPDHRELAISPREATQCKGGYLTIYFSQSLKFGGGAGDTEPDIFTWLIKNIKVTFNKQSTPIEVEDVELHGYLDANFSEKLEVPVKQGFADRNTIRSGIIENVNEAWKFVPAFTRAGNTGKLEELMLNTYLSNYKESRYVLHCKTTAPRWPFSVYHYALLDRDAIPVTLMTVERIVDHNLNKTVLTLQEIVADELTIVNV